MSFVWSESARESIVGVVCCCEWSMSFVFVRLGQSVEVWMDLPFFWLLGFLILYRLYIDGPLVEYVQVLACKDGAVQLV
jgi:hypothetical protein